jgi:mono/diheme cytochrome c family protein
MVYIGELIMNINTLNRTILFIFFIFSSISAVNAAASGEQLYLENCMTCHAYDGKGSMPGVLDLKEDKAWLTVDEQSLLSRIKQGIKKPGSRFSMPAKGGNPNLTDDDLKKIIRYMKQSF